MHVKQLFFVALVLPAVVCAAESSTATVGDLSKVQSETIMFEAKAKRAEAKAKMLENITKAGDDPQLNQPQAVVSVNAADLPTVTGISGAAGRLFATFRYGNGTTVTSKSGEQIPGGFQVAEVGIDRVVLTKGDRRIPLQFGVATPVAQPTQMPTQMPGLPGMGTPFAPPTPMH